MSHDPRQGDEPEPGDDAADGDLEARQSDPGEAEEGLAAGDAPAAEASAEAMPGEDASGEEDAAPDDAAPAGPGELLGEARQARGATLQQAAEALNLTPRVLEDLEADDYSAMPGSAFVRGYLRSYARFLALDVEAVLERHRQLVGEPTEPQIRPAVSLGPAPSSESVIHRHTGLAMTLLTLVVLGGAGALIYLAWPEAAPIEESGQSAPVTATPAPGAASATTPEPTPAGGDARALPATEAPAVEAAAPSGTDAASAGEASGPGPDAAPAPTEDGAAPTGDEPVAPAQTDAQAADRGPDVVDVTREAVDDGNSARIFAGGDDHLQFSFSGDCWVEVRDADGVDIFANLQTGGQQLDIWGRAPFSILLGYAPAVQLVYNDQPIALRPFTRNDVANLVLGR